MLKIEIGSNILTVFPFLDENYVLSITFTNWGSTLTKHAKKRRILKLQKMFMAREQYWFGPEIANKRDISQNKCI